MGEHNLGGIINYSVLKQLLTAHEGVRAKIYKDTVGKRTVGVGFNMDKVGARAEFESVLPHVSFDAVLSGRALLSSDDIQALLDHSIGVAVGDSTFLVPSFDAQPENVKYVLVDMAFMGRAAFSGFRKFLAAVSREDYPAAVAEITNSYYYHQVGKRAQDLVALLNTAANYRTFPEAGNVTSPEKPVSASS